MEKNYLFDEFTNEFLNKRQAHACTNSLKAEAVNYLHELIDFLFPHFSKKVYSDSEDVLANLQLLKRNLVELIKQLNGNTPQNASEIADLFINKIPEIHSKLWNDAQAIHSGDPASESIDEVILAYPGFMAIVIYRLSHELYLLKVPIIPRIMSEHAHQITGIDIHPGASIGSPFFIDHGTGIVIGETTVIGKNVKIYQGVTLGALSVDKSLAQTKRHPTIEDDVIIYSQAVILGGSTVIGKNSVIGGNSWVTQSIPPDSVVYNKSEVRIKTNKEFEEPINFII
ncbi:MAG: serine acetyltransferase [Stygiobacter sp. RIFOXYC12_FULL_38_8]|nr:MAG: serine acetyltransferase [Stygiobacter sp. GWC2_38_9]OGU78919.1 MAG: serine acetyltransferase [Stygiobacter sp. RIFOXYA12_FULL_38_9]OGV07138.1 MAG: serine acetyltransferase [Stygiobacter sp. RIFOXYB2_FULL_37_11]OGV12345.1 MAG: serine acetyltransferase [Stygiobacter sp. RIFOXYC2_FULL_38_25]OGV25214.1 MAG: serine acetyltransferase [Stygiobacter sp. RIFOXYC12_FULL_38_8]OGV83103.1 MAG: serine acetyltransferase [Stygiobacter sp. GWF2_38_21]RJQ62909.1 MAG: serine acetyltransferase [Stygioba